MTTSTAVRLVPGALVGNRYQILQQEAEGEDAVTCLAQDTRLGGQVVLRGLRLPDTSRARLEREVPATRDLLDGHLVPLFDLLRVGPWSMLVTGALPSAMPLTRLVAASGPLDPGQVAAVGRSVALGLRAAHRRGLLHRAVAPEHVIINGDGRTRLAGLAWAAAELELRAGLPGRFDYTAPEQVAGQTVDQRADVYGLGLTLFFALTGRLPERSADGFPPALVTEGHRPSHYTVNVPAWLDLAIARATTALPADRYSSAGRLAEGLLAAEEPRLGAEAALS